MADDLVADWRVQSSFRFGPGGQHMLNVRADDFAELGELLDSIPADIADKLGSATAALNLIHSVAAATGGPVETVSVQATPPAPAGDAAPTCAHGARVYKSGISAKTNKPWAAYMCSGPRGGGQCDPIFKGKENEREKYWP